MPEFETPDQSLGFDPNTIKKAQDGDTTAQLHLAGAYETMDDLKHAFYWYKQAADHGEDAYAEYKIGTMYQSGEGGIEQDRDFALDYLKRAAYQNHTLAHYILGDMYFHGSGVTKTETMAFSHYEMAANQGHADAQNQVAHYYESGLGDVSKDLTKAFEWYTKSAEQKNGAGCYGLAKLYLHGLGVEKDKEKALYFYQEAAEQGLEDAQFKLGLLYEKGEDVEKDEVVALTWYEKAAENEDYPEANYHAGKIYFDRQDYEKANQHFEKAAEMEDAAAIYQLGVSYENGYGFEKDVSRAFSYYTEAADKKYALAHYRLGQMYMDGVGVDEVDHSLAAKHFKISTYMGAIPDAQFMVGYLYHESHQHRAYDSAVLYWYEKAAEKNHVLANYKLGLMYFYGTFATERDYNKAFTYYKVAADQGNAFSQLKIGYCYEHGLGVEQVDHKQAFEWYKRAADQNMAAAHYHLGCLYSSGNGVENKDDTIAEGYYNTARDLGYETTLDYIGTRYGEIRNVLKEGDLERLKMYIKVADEKEDLAAMYRLGLLYYYGNDDVYPEHERAYRYLKIVAEHEYAPAQAMLGLMYYMGEGIFHDKDPLAIEWYEKSFKQEKNKVQNSNVIQHYLYNDDVLRYEKRKIIAAATAEELGGTKALLQLGKIYQYGEGVEIDYDRAIELYTKSTEEENSYEAYNLLGEIYHYASTGIQDFSKSLEWYNKVILNTEDDSYYIAKNVRGFALRNIGLLYEYGHGVEQDYTKALEYYKKSSEEWSIGGHYNLALLYYHGRGVEKNLTTTLELLKEGVENRRFTNHMCVIYETGVDDFSQDDTIPNDQEKKYSTVGERTLYGRANYRLGIMYENGIGVERDHNEAIDYFEEALDLHIDEASEYLDPARTLEILEIRDA